MPAELNHSSGIRRSVRLLVLIAGSTALILMMSALSTRSLSGLAAGADWVAHTERVRLQLERLLALTVDAGTSAREYARSGDESILDSYHAAAPAIAPELDRLDRMIADNPQQQQRAAQLRGLMRALSAFNATLLEAERDGDRAKKRALFAAGTGGQIVASARALLSQMQAQEMALLEMRRAAAVRARANAALALWTTVGLAVVLIVFVVYYTRRHEARLRQTEIELATTLRNVGDGVISTNLAGSIRFMNKVAERLTGWTEQSARGSRIEDVFRIVNEETRATVANPVQSILRHGKFVGLANHTVLISRDGVERAIADSGAPIVNDAGKLCGAVLVFRDVAEERHAERTLRMRESELRIISDYARLPIARCDQRHHYLYVNRAYAERLGLTPEQCVGKHIREIAGEAAYESVRAHIEAALGGEVVEFEARIPYQGFSTRFMRCIYAPERDEDGNIRSFVAAVTDITDRKASEDALRASEARFRAVQETSIDGFMILESVRNEAGQIAEFRWIHANEAAARIIGKPHSWFRGRYLLQEHPGNRDLGLFDAYVRVVETGAPFTKEFQYSQDGIEAYLRVVAAKSEDGFAVTFADLSERRRAEEQLENRERQFVGLANAIPQLAWTETAAGVHEYFNRGWYAYTGLSEAEALRPDAWRKVLHTDDAPRVIVSWARSLRTGEAFESEFRLRRHDGAYRWFLARAIADRSEQDKILQWFGTCTDIDASKRTEEALRKTEAALREADLRKDVFLATLSHELRNPLAPIRTAARLLDSPHLDPCDLSRAKTIISRQVVHMSSLLDDLLDVSRITRGVLLLKKQYVPLRGLLDAAVETAQPLIDARGHRLMLDLSGQPLLLEVDPVRITQVVSNLLTNAAKYTNERGRIVLESRLESQAVIISVRDNGIGLAAEMTTRVFEMFTQVEADSERSEGGLGIGLALVKGLVELHGGRIEARSAGIGQGCEFIISLPRSLIVHRQADLQPVPARSQSGARAPRRVLVADDNRDGAETLAMMLKLSGHEVHIAHSGADALEVASRLRPAISILDIGMPGLTGYEVARRIRREAWGARMVLVAVTGWGQEEDKRRAQAAGFDHHLTKPMDLAVLEEILGRATGAELPETQT